jgi:hypothetical protein
MHTKREILTVVGALVIIAAIILVGDRVVSGGTGEPLLTADSFKVSHSR